MSNYNKSPSKLFGLNFIFFLFKFFLPKACSKSSNCCRLPLSSAESNYLKLNPVHCSASSWNKVRSDKLSTGKRRGEGQSKSSIHRAVVLSLTFRNVDSLTSSLLLLPCRYLTSHSGCQVK